MFTLDPVFFLLLFLMIPPPPRSTLFPYTTLFRSSAAWAPFREVAREAKISSSWAVPVLGPSGLIGPSTGTAHEDRKSTRLNSSHTVISYAVFCLKKKKRTKNEVSTEREQDERVES